MEDANIIQREKNKVEQISIDFNSKFYKNCIKRRKEEAKICGDCPFRSYIERLEIIEFRPKMLQWFNEHMNMWHIEGNSWIAYDREKGFHRITLNEESYIYYNYCGGKDGWSENTCKYDKDGIDLVKNISTYCKRFRYIEKV